MPDFVCCCRLKREVLPMKEVAKEFIHKRSSDVEGTVPQRLRPCWRNNATFGGVSALALY